MIRYRYSALCDPPAPFVHVSVACPITGTTEQDLAAQIDSAADRTLIPQELATRLCLVPMREIKLAGLGTGTYTVSTSLVIITIRQMKPVTIEVAAMAGEPWVLLGRDLLAHFKVLLDGPGQAVELA